MAGCSITNKVLLVPRPPWPTNCTEMDTPSCLLSLLFLLPFLFHSCISFDSSTRPSDGHILLPFVLPSLCAGATRPRRKAKTKEAAASSPSRNLPIAPYSITVRAFYDLSPAPIPHPHHACKAYVHHNAHLTRLHGQTRL